MRVGITGSSGLIGTAVVTALTANGHTARPIVRREPRLASSEIAWDPASGTVDRRALCELDAIIHLAGAGIGDHRWTTAYKQLVLSSRVQTTTLLAATMAELGDDGPQTLISGSAVGFYGDRADETVDESSDGGSGFLADVCRAWEASTSLAEEAGIRVAHIRTGVVLSRDGGALKKMLPLFKLGAGGRFGTGRQWMSWVSIDDHVRAIEHLLTSTVSGPVNLTAPNPVRNADFATALARVLGRPSAIPVPSFGPRLLLGSELADALLFEGQRVLPTVLQGDGYEFLHADLDTALHAVLGR